MRPPPIACRREPQVTVRTKTLQCCLAPFGKGPSLHLIHRPSVAYSPPALRGSRSVLRSPKAAPRTSFSVLHRLAYAAMTRLSSRSAASGGSSGRRKVSRSARRLVHETLVDLAPRLRRRATPSSVLRGGRRPEH